MQAEAQYYFKKQKMIYSFKNPLPIVVLISGNGSNLQAIIDAIAAKQLPAKICAVISNHVDAYGLERARRASIPTHILSNADFKNPKEYDDELQKIIEHYQPALIVLAGFMRILTPTFVNHFVGKIINIHPSLLPKYRGLNTHQRVLTDKEREHGVTVHFVTADLDAGPIIAQEKIDIDDDDTAASLKEKIHKIEHQLYPKVIRLIAEDKINLKHPSI